MSFSLGFCKEDVANLNNFGWKTKLGVEDVIGDEPCTDGDSASLSFCIECLATGQGLGTRNNQR
jgi:hypothetical protein